MLHFPILIDFTGFLTDVPLHMSLLGEAEGTALLFPCGIESSVSLRQGAFAAYPHRQRRFRYSTILLTPFPLLMQRYHPSGDAPGTLQTSRMIFSSKDGSWAEYTVSAAPASCNQYPDLLTSPHVPESLPAHRLTYHVFGF